MARRREPTFGQQVIESARSLRAALAKGGRLSDHLRVDRVVLDTGPRAFSARDIRVLRGSLGMSQSVFALLLAVSPRTIQSWEQGGSTPTPVVRRLLEAIEADPAPYIDRVFLSRRRRSA